MRPAVAGQQAVISAHSNALTTSPGLVLVAEHDEPGTTGRHAGVALLDSKKWRTLSAAGVTGARINV
jgi:hypothetical protein